MLEFFVTCSLVVYLVASLYGAYRIFASRRAGPAGVDDYDRRFRMISGRARLAIDAQDMSYQS